MKNATVLTDAIAAFRAVRNARKAGGAVCVRIGACREIQPEPGLYDTVEGCALHGCGKAVCQAAQGMFHDLPRETKRRLAFAPKDGEFCARAQFWQGALRPVLPPGQYRSAMGAILQWYRRIKRMERRAAV